MTLLIKQIINFIELLNSAKGKNQIAAGIACGFILGMTPAFSLQTVLVYIIIFLFRVQIGAALLTAVFFAIPAYLLDPVFDKVGSLILESDSLTPLFTSLYHMPIVPMTRFNNSIVMGSGVVAIILAPVVFFVSRILIDKYRETIVARLQKTKLWHAWKASTIYQWYGKYKSVRGLVG